MRIFKKIYIKHVNEEKSIVYIFYSNNTFISVSVNPQHNTDGTTIESIILNKQSLKNGTYALLDNYIELFSDKLNLLESWNKINDNKFISNDFIIFEYNDHVVIEKFIANNQEILLAIEPIDRDYYKLQCETNQLTQYYIVNWFLGNTCSFQCSYCPSYLNDGSIPWMDIDVLKKFIDKLFILIKDKTIVFEFTGGEVTLYKDFGTLCEYIKSKGGIIFIISNGSRTLDWWNKNLHNFDQVALSYHTEFADKKHFIDLVELLKEKVDLSVNVMMPPGKLDECKLLAIAVKNLKNSVVHIMPIIEDLEGELLKEYTKEELDYIDQFNLNSAEFATYSKRQALDFKGNMSKYYLSGEKKIISPPSLVSNKENGWLGWDCYSGVSQIAINANGDIYRGWCLVGGVCGNIANPSVSLPSSPIKCNKELCHCNFDLYSIKERII